MRLLPLTTVLCGVLLLTACAPSTSPERGNASSRTPSAASTRTPTATPVPTPTATPTAPDPVAAEQEKVDAAVRLDVNLYGSLVCNTLVDMPGAEVNDLVAAAMAQTANTEGFSEEARLQLAQRVLTESVAENCPDQSARVTEGIQAG